MKHARAHAALHLRLRVLQRRGRNFLVTALDRGLDLLDEAAHARGARLVDRAAALGLTYGFLRRLMVGHLGLASGNALNWRPRVISAACPAVKHAAGRPARGKAW